MGPSPSTIADAMVPLPKHSLGRNRQSFSILPKFHLGRGTVRRTVEGHAIASLRDNVTDNAVQIAKHFASGDAQHGHPMPGQKRIATSIPLRPVATLVSFAIHLDRQPRRRAIEIQHISPRRMLSSKAQPLGPLAQDTPQHDLRQRHIPPHSPCASHRPARLRRYSHRPSTIADAMVPLPKHSLGRNEVETYV